MPPLRVLHVTPYSADAWAYGGIPRLTDSITSELVGRGHHVTVCATDVADAGARLSRPGPPRARLEPWSPITTPAGVELRVFPNVSNSAAYHWQAFAPLGLADYLRTHARDFDIGHLHACRNLPGVLAAWHLREAGVPYVLAPNGTAPRLERRLVAKRVFDAIFGHRVLRGAARVLAVSEAERQQLLNLGVADESIAVVPNPIGPGAFRRPSDRGRFRQRTRLGSQPVVLFLGKLTPRKRLDVLIEAFSALDHQDAHLVIAGNDMGAGEAARAQVAALGLGARTTFTGLLRGGERLEALADADVVVYPSEHEIFGLVPLEALLAGTPVVVSDDSGCGEVIRSTGGGQVVGLGDAAELGRAIGRVLDAPVEWRRAARAGAEQARKRFGGPVVAEAIEGLYRRVLEATPEPRPETAASTRPPSTSRNPLPGVSFVLPVRNGARWLRAVIDAIWAQASDRPIEIIVINDGSTDRSAAILDGLAAERPLRILEGYGKGAAAAINIGIRAARYDLVAQVDQDVVLQPGWLDRLAAALDDESVGAAQGYYETRPDASMIARVTGLDLEQRYAAIVGDETSHVCTGNSLYRRRALVDAGLFDERFGYGYDNDMSYRLRDAGHRLVLCREARSVHHWRESFRGYTAQQYGQGYGRLDLVAKHPGRAGGDSVSPLRMMAHPALMALAGASLFAAPVLFVMGGPWTVAMLLAAGLLTALGLERLVAGVRAAGRFGDPAALLFPAAHLWRDLVWVAAGGVWLARRILGRPPRATDSMRPRPADVTVSPGRLRAPLADDARVLGVIPAHNEASTLPAVIAGLREHCPGLDILVVDDGSRDGTADVLEELGVRWLRLPERMGIGSAMRAGLRYAQRLGYDAAVRLDGDGQHGAGDIDRILDPLRRAEADVVLGTRFSLPHRSRRGVVRLVQRLLAAWLSKLTGAAVTDPTSGFCAIGSRALHVLAEHHPTGYPEPELRLFLNRNGLTAVEVPVDSRPRLGGRSSLTAGRITLAGARVLLAMLIVPLRSIVVSLDRD